MDNRPVGVFDSGLGGLTTVKKLMQIMPNEDIIYLGDTGRVPYGGRSKETIIRYARQDMAFLQKFDIKAVVIACGTVSTNALSEIEGDYDIPVLGVVNAAAAAAVSATKTGRIGIIGTKASIRSGAYDRRIKALMPNAEIFKNACPLFVPLVENGRLSPEDIALKTVAEEYLAPLRESQTDVLIMGCTHYPIIKEAIGTVMGENVQLIDPGAETVLELQKYLRTHGELAEKKNGGNCRYFVTDCTDDFASVASLFLESDVMGAVERITLE